MATVFSPPPSVPSENWDDDFEFHQNANNSNAATDSHSAVSPGRTRISTTSSHFTEDWDNDLRMSPSAHDKRPSAIPAADDMETIFDTSKLSNWAEQGPSTPTRRLPTSSTENWDDDFEDKADSPAQRSSARKICSRPRQSSDSASFSRLGANMEPESWDDEFDLMPATPSKQQHDPYLPSEGHQAYHGDADDDDDDDDDMGFNLDKEEDRTVTARSRRAVLSRLATTNNASPPPPVPPIPFSLLNTAPHEQPFPRSPTASVFSVPTTGRDSVAYSYYHNNSTTHLRPTISRSSITGLANLPPSPPIHKERERRRLRKKSRPHEPAMELSIRNPASPLYTMNTSRESIEGRGVDEGVRAHPQTPPLSTPPPATSPDVITSPLSSSSVGPSSPPSKTPLLSRIGSVKKWGVRKKRASSTPSEVMLQETERQADLSGIMQEHTPRPPSASGLPTTSSSRSNWFFRASSSGNHGSSMAASSSSSKSELNDNPHSSFIHTPKASTRSGAPASTGVDVPFDTPSKLVKRKSFGFVPIRRNNGPLNDIDGLPVASHANALTSSGDLPSDLEMELGLDSDVVHGRSPSKKKKNRHSMTPQQPRHASYGGLGLGRASGASAGSSDDLAGKEGKRSRTRSFSRSKSRDQRVEKEREETEGSRSFMGNVRRISLVGKHKRTKSGVSLASVGEGIRNSQEKQRSPSPKESQVNGDVMDVDLDAPSASTRPRSGTLLPPIELQPPSPPRVASDATIGKSAQPIPPVSLDNLLLPSSSTASSLASSPIKPSVNKPPSSPQSASLGRSTVAPSISASSLPTASSNVPRRNSLGDLKIPARISQAQVGLRRDLSMVREFASNVEQLRELQRIYHSLVSEVQNVLDIHAQQASSRAASPNFFRPLSRVRSNTSPTNPAPAPHQAYKNLAAAFYTINSKYRITWECAELLIDLGSGTAGSASTSPPSTSVSAPSMSSTYPVITEGKRSRERAITLSGEQSKPPTPVPGSSSSAGHSGPPLASPPNMAWRASTGRHDLSQRQLLLLREMLNNPDSSFVIDTSRGPITEEASATVNRDWRWGEAMNSTITLPSEESSAVHSGGISPTKKRRSSRLVGMSGLRDMLRSLKKSYTENSPMSVPVSSTSLSTESSLDSQRRHPREKVATYGRRRAKTSSGPDSVTSARDRDQDYYSRSPYNTSSLSMKPSPRRPSLASIFRIGGKSKPSPAASTQGSSISGVSTDNVSVGVHNRGSSSSTGGDEEDWDRLDYPTEFDTETRTKDAATIRGRSPYMQDVQLPSGRPITPNKRSASNSQSSLWGDSSPVGVPSRATRLSNVEENVDDHDHHRGSKVSLKIGSSSGRPPSRSRHIEKTGSVRSMPPRPLLPDTKLAMTPENIKPLLENAKEVYAQLTNCIAEIRALLAE